MLIYLLMQQSKNCDTCCCCVKTSILTQFTINLHTLNESPCIVRFHKIKHKITCKLKVLVRQPSLSFVSKNVPEKINFDLLTVRLINRNHY